MVERPQSVERALSGSIWSNQTYIDAVYDTERYVTDETESLWLAAEEAVHDGEYAIAMRYIATIWKEIEHG